jgi:hypothetical protein
MTKLSDIYALSDDEIKNRAISAMKVGVPEVALKRLDKTLHQMDETSRAWLLEWSLDWLQVKNTGVALNYEIAAPVDRLYLVDVYRWSKDGGGKITAYGSTRLQAVLRAVLIVSQS